MRSNAGLLCRLSALSVLALLVPLLAVARPQPAAAAGVVNQCTEAALRNAVAGGGLVSFSCSGTIPLTSRLEIFQDTIIDGGGVVTLDGQSVTQLLYVGTGVELTLRGLTLTNGFTTNSLGGALWNDGTLTIEASTVTGNSSPSFGGAMYNNGTLAIESSTVADNSSTNLGGAIYNDGILTITDSTLSGNTTVGGAWGGAIYNASALTITGSTLSGNHAGGLGGAIYNASALTIIASTLSGNSGSNGGAIYNSGALTIIASTLIDNSALFASAGTIGNAGSVELTASILSSSSNLCSGFAVGSNGYNVASDDSCNLAATGDIQNADPLLGPLVHNGGSTETQMPLTGSPALNRVPNAVCTTLAAANDGHDQRGAQRPESAGLACDSGAVEVQVNSFFCVGERSGSLRHVSIPNGCVRGEYRLLPSAEGVYAFCVGDHSGSMRYLPNSGTNCLRGETKLLLPQVDPITICVGERSRTVRYVADAAACNPRGELAYSIINPAG